MTNPFNSNTTLSFSLPTKSLIDISIYNIKGQKIKTLAEGEFTTGKKEIIWNGVDENNKPVKSGIYFYRFETPEKTINKKLILMR